MGSKKKIIIAISAFAMVILAAVVAVVAVLAAQEVTISSTMRITYDATGVYGTARAWYSTDGGNSYTQWDADIPFDNNGSHELSDVALSKPSGDVVVKFGFQKDANTKDYQVTLLSKIVEEEYMIVEYGQDSLTGLTTWTDSDVDGRELTMFDKVKIDKSGDTSNENNWKYFYIKLSRSETKYDAKLGINFAWKLGEYVEPTPAT